MSADFRITHPMVQRRVVSNLTNNLSRLAVLQDKLSSGKELRRPSDSPVGVISALRLRGDVRRTEQISRNLDDAATWLNVADGALVSMVEHITRVRDLAIQSKNAALDANARAALANEVERIRENLIGLANTRAADRPVFGGNTSGADAYTADGVFVGESAPVERTVAPGVRLQINVNGDDVFGPAGTSLFDVIQDVAADIRSGIATDVDAGIVALDGRTTAIQDAIGQVGARARRIETMQEANDLSSITLRQQLSDIEDIDLPKVLTDLQIQETAYKAALEATARVIQPTLVDFLR